jgi:hypothetical protein
VRTLPGQELIITSGREVIVQHSLAGDEACLRLIFPHLGGLQVGKVEDGGNAVLFTARASGAEAPCHRCGVPSGRVHSRYRRRLHDLAAAAPASTSSGRESCSVTNTTQSHQFTDFVPEPLSHGHGHGGRPAGPTMWRDEYSSASKRCQSLMLSPPHSRPGLTTFSGRSNRARHHGSTKRHSKFSARLRSIGVATRRASFVIPR